MRQRIEQLKAEIAAARAAAAREVDSEAETAVDSEEETEVDSEEETAVDSEEVVTNTET